MFGLVREGWVILFCFILWSGLCSRLMRQLNLIIQIDISKSYILIPTLIKNEFPFKLWINSIITKMFKATIH